MAIAGFRSFLHFWVGGAHSLATVGPPETSIVRPPIASSDRFVLYAIPESAWDVIPTLSAVARNTPVVNMKGGTQITRKIPPTYRRDNQRTASLVVQSHAEAHIEFELRPESHDELCAAVVGGTFFRPAGLVGLTDVYVSGPSQSFVVVNGINWVNLGVTVGMWVQVAGFLLPQNNGIFYILKVTPTTLVVASGALVSESAALTESFTLNIGFRIGHVHSGHAKRTFFLEGQHQDAILYQQWKGMQPTSCSVELHPHSLIQGTMDFVGAETMVSTVSLLDPAFLCAARAKECFDTGTGVLALYEGSAPITAPVTALSITMENASETLPRLSQPNPHSVRLGPMTAHGSLQVYFDSLGLKDRFLTNPHTSLQLHLQTQDGDRTIFTFPNVLLTQAESSIEGRDRDTFVQCSWDAFVDPLQGFTVAIDAFPATTFTYAPFSTNVPLVEYFLLRDQASVIWVCWIDSAGQLACSTEVFSLRDETPVSLSTGTIPYWHQVTDELGGTWYLYPDVTGEMIVSSASPSTGAGLTIGLGQQVRGVNHTLYRVGVQSTQEVSIEVIDTTWESAPRVWYIWLDGAAAFVRDRFSPTFYPGLSAVPVENGVPPAYYQIAAQPSNADRYLTIVATTGAFSVFSSPPSGAGLAKGTGIDLITIARMLYRLVINASDVPILQLQSSICGV